jgi:hypothetical protein
MVAPAALSAAMVSNGSTALGAGVPSRRTLPVAASDFLGKSPDQYHVEG